MLPYTVMCECVCVWVRLWRWCHEGVSRQTWEYIKATTTLMATRLYLKQAITTKSRHSRHVAFICASTTPNRNSRSLHAANCSSECCCLSAVSCLLSAVVIVSSGLLLLFRTLPISPSIAFGECSLARRFVRLVVCPLSPRCTTFT